MYMLLESEREQKSSAILFFWVLYCCQVMNDMLTIIVTIDNIEMNSAYDEAPYMDEAPLHKSESQQQT